MAIAESYIKKFQMLSEYNVRNVNGNGFYNKTENDDIVPSVDDEIIDEDDVDTTDKDSTQQTQPAAPEAPKTDATTQPEAPAPTTEPVAPESPEASAEDGITSPSPAVSEPISDDYEKKIFLKQIEAFTAVLSSIDRIGQSLDALTTKIENNEAQFQSLKRDVEEVKEPTDQEKLEMRSLDSFPYNQKLNDVWKSDPSDEINMRGIEKKGDEFIGHTDQLPQFSKTEIEKSLT